MTTAAAVLDVARSQLGTTEQPPGSNYVARYHDWYGATPGWSWCAIWVSWVFAQAGIHGWKHHYTPTGVAMFRAAGLWHDDLGDRFRPEPGDVAYFDFPDAVWRVQHVGLVESVRPDGLVVCLEGNTSGGDSGSQDNGGGVFRRVRPPRYIVGYGRPIYGRDTLVMDEAVRRRFQALEDSQAGLAQRLDWLAASVQEAWEAAEQGARRSGNAVKALATQGKVLKRIAGNLEDLAAELDDSIATAGADVAAEAKAHVAERTERISGARRDRPGGP